MRHRIGSLLLTLGSWVLGAGICLFAVGCEAPKPPLPRWLIAREDVDATDDRGVHLRAGFGIGVVEQRPSATGSIVRSQDGHWFPSTAFGPAAPLVGPAAAPLPTVAAPPSRPVELQPVELQPGERWLDVEISTQRLVAYEGERAVRAMKISSGAGEEGAAYATPKGLFRIYAKLRSATMASAPVPVGAPADPHPYRFEAVPDVQYFNREIALHGAYWHRRFGERVSHGCVNLSPADAAWLFEFTAPQLLPSEHERAVPPREPGARGKAGTLVLVH